jgi:CheY-like chemotaxis protein
MDGLTTIRGLRRICESQPVPLILMDNRQTYETLLADVIPESDRPDAFLIKPSTGSMLFDAYTEASSEGLFMDSRIEVRRRGEELAGLKLLLVEDNPFNQQVASELLTRNGAEVDIANNGLEGMERALAVSRPYDAILMDVQMPVMDGYEATRQIRAKGRKDQVIIAMTANAFQSDRDACLAVGMNAYVSKPFTVDALLKVIIEARGSILKQTNEAIGKDSDLLEILDEISSRPEDSALDPVTERQAVIFDIQSALTLLDEDRSLLQDLVNTFWENYPEQRATLETAIERADSALARNQAHALKGNAGYFFALEFKDCAYHLEVLCRDQQLDEARTYLPQLDAAIERFMEACKAQGLK